jgi:DnaK suppressor protein
MQKIGLQISLIMDKNNLEHIAKAIKEEIAKTELSIKNYKELTKPIAPENAIGRVSRMDAINNKSVNEAALKKAEQKLNNLNVALSNINDPDFGVCFKCNNTIPIGRILLIPHTRFCVQCAR